MALSGAGVYEALLARSWAARYHDPAEMLRLASAAPGGLECQDEVNPN